MDSLRRWLKTDEMKKTETDKIQCDEDISRCNTEKQICENRTNRYDEDGYITIDYSQLNLYNTYYQKYINKENEIRYFPGILTKFVHQSRLESDPAVQHKFKDTPIFEIDNITSIKNAGYLLSSKDKEIYYVPNGKKSIYEITLLNQEYYKIIKEQEKEIKILEESINSLEVKKGGRKYNRTRKNIRKSKSS